jgi:uncharacterized membrane protein
MMSRRLAGGDRWGVWAGRKTRVPRRGHLAEAAEVVGLHCIRLYNLLHASMYCVAKYAGRAHRTNGLRRVARSFHRGFLRPLLLLRALQHLVEAGVDVWLVGVVGHGGWLSEGAAGV